MIRASFALMVLLGVALAAAACSKAAMDAHPFHTREVGTSQPEPGPQPEAVDDQRERVLRRAEQTRERAAAGRINIWPFVYRDRDDLSVLWPFFASSPQGNAFLPLYEWQTDEKTFRFLTIHHDVPPLFILQDGGSYWRFLNVFRWGGDEGGFHAFPFLLYNSYDREEGESHWHAGPLLFHSSRTPRENITVLLGPLYIGNKHHQRGARWDWILFPLLHRALTERQHAYWMFPVAGYRREFAKDGRHFYSLPLSLGGDEESYWGNLGTVLAFWRGDRGVRSRFHLLLGALYSQRNVFEEAARERMPEELVESRNVNPQELETVLRSRRALLWFFRYQERLVASREAMEAPWRTEAGDVSFRREKDSWLFPLYYWARSENERKFELLWPLYRHRAEGLVDGGEESRTRVLGWLYNRRSTPERSTAYSFPFFYSASTEEKRKFELLWRLFDHRAEALPDGGYWKRSRVLWRLYNRESVPGATTVDVFPFVAYDEVGEEFKRFSFAGGLYEFQRDEGRRRVRLLYLIRFGV